MSNGRKVSWLQRVSEYIVCVALTDMLFVISWKNIYDILLSLSMKLEFIISLEMQFFTSLASCEIRKTQFIVFIYVTTHTYGFYFKTLHFILAEK